VIPLLLCCSSAKAPVIENADRAIATASKLHVGAYSFKLVVKDGEGLTSEDVVKITVKEGSCHLPVFTLLVNATACNN